MILKETTILNCTPKVGVSRYGNVGPNGWAQQKWGPAKSRAKKTRWKNPEPATL